MFVILILSEIWLYNPNSPSKEIPCSPRWCTLSSQRWLSESTFFSSVFSYPPKIGKIYYLLLSGKTFHFPDASPSGNIIDLLLKCLEEIMLSCILHAWSGCHHCPCISIMTCTCPFPWARRSSVMLTLLKFTDVWIFRCQVSGHQKWKHGNFLLEHQTYIKYHLNVINFLKSHKCFTHL